MIRQVLKEFIGAAPFYLIVAALLMWGVFRILKARTNLHPTGLMVLSYVVVGGILGGITLISVEWNDTMFIDHKLRHLFYLELCVLICLGTGLLIWTRRVHKRSTKQSEVMRNT
jgi:hypothetical protein